MRRFAFASAIVALASVASATTVQSNLGSWNGSNSVQPFGSPNTQTYGQVFTVPAGDTVLNRFTFFLNDFSGSTVFDVRVMAWDAMNFSASGSALFTSGSLATTNNGGQGGMERFDVGMSLSLMAGAQYVAFFTTSESPQNGNQSTAGFIGGSGNFVFRNNGTDLSLLTSTPWENFVPGNLAHELEFSAAVVPVPAAAATALSGLAMMGVFGHRRRRA